MLRGSALAFLLAIVSTPSTACEFEPPSGWLPGYTEEQQAARSAEIMKAARIIDSFERIEKDMNDAEVIYLAKVLSSQDLARDAREKHATVQPLNEIKGVMPKSRQLTSLPPNVGFCGGFALGDGDATFGEKGELVVVFEGLPPSSEHPRGIDSVLMNQVFYGPLLDKVDSWASSQPDYRPFP